MLIDDAEVHFNKLNLQASTAAQLTMLKEARERINKDAQETKNLVKKFVNQVIVYENDIQVSLNLILDTIGGGGAWLAKSTIMKQQLLRLDNAKFLYISFT